MEKELLLLDTDIGSDIDDAVCLAYLLMQPRCELLGITTVSGQPVERAMIADAIVKAAGREVPIFPGAEYPMLTGIRQPKAQQAAALGQWPHATAYPEGQAVSFLYDTIKKNPGKVTLLAIGPMTNVGLLFAEHPDAAAMLKSLVLMCGVFTNALPGVGPLEWNALNDPYATALTYKGAAPVHRSIGLDVTMQVKMDAVAVRKRFTHPVLQPVNAFAEVWFEHAKTMTFHDPLAAVTIFEEVCTFERGDVDVELQSPRLMGMTHFTRAAGGRHEAALGVSPELFFEKYFEVFQ